MDFHAWANVFTHWPTDWIIIGAAVALIALDALRSGSARAAALALSLPATMLLLNALPKAFLAGPFAAGLKSPTEQLFIFAVIFVALYFATHRIIFTFSDGGGVIQALIAGLAATIVLVVVWLQVPSLETLWHFGDQVQLVFGEAYRFWWLLVAYLGLAFVRS